jgi:hypothetical protein
VPACGIEQRSEICFQVAPGKEVLNNIELGFTSALETRQGLFTHLLCDHEYSPIVWDWAVQI